MKKAFAIIVFVLIALFYCFAINIPPLVDDLGNNTPKEATIGKYSFVSSPSANLIGGTVYSRTLSQNTSIPLFAFASSFEEFGRVIEYTGQLFASKFAQYSFFSINLLIEKKKSNLIFPSHYFW